jgi:hypothetical protein
MMKKYAGLIVTSAAAFCGSLLGSFLGRQKKNDDK